MGVLIKNTFKHFYCLRYKQETYQSKAHISLILKTSFISSIHEDITPSDKVLSEKSKFLSEILMILVSKRVKNYRLFNLYATQMAIFHMEVKLNACTLW